MNIIMINYDIKNLDYISIKGTDMNWLLWHLHLVRIKIHLLVIKVWFNYPVNSYMF